MGVSPHDQATLNLGPRPPPHPKVTKNTLLLAQVCVLLRVIHDVAIRFLHGLRVEGLGVWWGGVS